MRGVKSASRKAVCQSDIFTFLVIGGLCFWYREAIPLWLDEIFLSLFGKNLSGRNPLLQIAVYGALLLFCLAIPILLRRLIERAPKFRWIADGLILLTLAVPTAQLLIICANQVLRRDDYWEIADAMEHGFPGSMFFEIKRYNGRYTGWGLKSLHALLPDIPYIDIFLFLNLILLTIGTSMLSYRLLKFQSGAGRSHQGMRLQSLATGFGLALSFVLLSSNIFEFWFWGSGTMIYGFGVSMCILSLALVWNASEEPVFRIRKMLLPALTCFLTCGCSELCTASLAAFLTLLLVWKWVREKKVNLWILFFLLEVFACCMLIFSVSASLDFSGTNAHWQSTGAEQPDSGFLQRLSGAFGWAKDALIGYTFADKPLLLLFLTAALITGTQMKFGQHTKHRLLILAGALMVIALAVLMINTLLDYMPPRVITVGICWLFTGLILLCLMLGSLLNRENRAHADRIKLLLCSLLFAAAANSFYSKNIDEIRSIRSSWYIREALLQMAANPEEPMLTCSLPCPGSSRDDILADPLDDFNIGTAQYYGVPAISAEHRCPPWGEIFLPPDPYSD